MSVNGWTVLLQTSRGGDDRALVELVPTIVRELFPDPSLRRGELSEAVMAGARAGPPPWMFFSSLAATGMAVGVAGGLLVWSSFEKNPATNNALQVTALMAIGTAAALSVVDVTLGLVTDW